MMKCLALLALAALVSCARAQEPPAADAGPTLHQWVAAHNRGDLDALVQAYATDVTLLPPDGSVVTGHDGVRATFAATLARDGVRLARITGWMEKDIAVEIGSWEHFARDTRHTTATGTYSVTWQRDEAGEWRIVANGWSVRPAPAATQEDTR